MDNDEENDQFEDKPKKKKVPPAESDNPRNVIWGFLCFMPGSPILALLLNFLFPSNLVGVGVLVYFATPVAFIIPFVIRKSYPNLSRGMRYGFGTWFLFFVALPFLGLTVLKGICTTIYLGSP